MGIRPPTDFVADVMQSAQPSRMREVVNKLKSMSSGNSAEFGATMTQAGASVPKSADEQARAQALAAIPAGMAFSGTSLVALRNAHALSQRSVDQFSTTQPQAAALKKFEGMVLAKFLDTIMPENSTVFGSGTAGSAWKTMLTEKMGDAIADAGGIGIAARMAKAAALRDSGGKTGEG